MSVLGTWKIAMKSPFGEQAFDLTFTDAPPRGVMSGDGDTSTEVRDVAINGDAVTFSQDVTTPMKMTISWDLAADGDSISGTAKAGIFPAQKVAGARA